MRRGPWFTSPLKALTLIPLAQLFAIEFTAPLWTALLAALLLKERLTTTRALAGLLGFAGVLVVVRPSGATLDLGSLCALSAAVLFAVYYIATKRLTSGDGALTLLFTMNLVQTGIATLLMLPQGGPPWPGLAAGGWVVVLTLCSLAAHFSLSRAFALADAIVVTPMDFLRLPLISVVGLAVYAEPLDAWVLIGAALVIAGNALNIVGEARRRDRA